MLVVSVRVTEVAVALDRLTVPYEPPLTLTWSWYFATPVPPVSAPDQLIFSRVVVLPTTWL